MAVPSVRFVSSSSRRISELKLDQALAGEKLNICVVSARRAFAYGEAFCGELALGCRNRDVGDKAGAGLAPAGSNQTG